MNDQLDLSEIRDSEPSLTPNEEQLEVELADVADGIEGMTCEERHPIPEDASRARRIRMLKLLKKRNQILRKEGGEYIDYESDFRIEVEEHLREQENAEQEM